MCINLDHSNKFIIKKCAWVEGIEAKFQSTHHFFKVNLINYTKCVSNYTVRFLLLMSV